MFFCLFLLLIFSSVYDYNSPSCLKYPSTYSCLLHLSFAIFCICLPLALHRLPLSIFFYYLVLLLFFLLFFFLILIINSKVSPKAGQFSSLPQTPFWGNIVRFDTQQAEFWKILFDGFGQKTHCLTLTHIHTKLQKPQNFGGVARCVAVLLFVWGFLPVSLSLSLSLLLSLPFCLYFSPFLSLYFSPFLSIFLSLSLSLSFPLSLSIFTLSLYILILLSLSLYFYLSLSLSLYLSLSLGVFLSLSLIPCAFAFNRCLPLCISLILSICFLHLVFCFSVSQSRLFLSPFLSLVLSLFLSLFLACLCLLFVSLLSFGFSGGPACHGKDLSYDMWALLNNPETNFPIFEGHMSWDRSVPCHVALDNFGK